MTNKSSTMETIFTDKEMILCLVTANLLQSARNSFTALLITVQQNSDISIQTMLW